MQTKVNLEYEKQYREIMNLDKLKEKNIDWLTQSINNFVYEDSYINKIDIIADLHYIMFASKKRQFLTVFKVKLKSDSDKNFISFANLYSRNTDFNFVSTGPTYISSDGEYKHKLIPVNQIDFLKNNSDFNKAKDFIKKQILPSIDIQVLNFFPDFLSDKNKKIFIKKLTNSDFELIFFTMVFTNEYIKTINSTVENHVSNSFKKVFSNPKFIKLVKNFKEFSDFLKLSGYRDYIYRILSDEKTLSLTICGQKNIQLTITDMENIKDIRLAPWRELYISEAVSDLVINNIAPGFPIFGCWFILQGLNENAYDNKASKQKFQDSNKSLEIAKNIETERKKTFTKLTNFNQEIFTSLKMNSFSEAIKIPISFAEKNIILSGYNLTIFSEHTGRTFADFPALLKSVSRFQKKFQSIFINKQYFSTFIFQFLYAILAMNEKLGVVHSDLHLNNVVIYLGFTSFIEEEDLYSLYELNSGEVYMLPSNGTNFYFIDFSRGFLWNLEKLRQEYTENQIAAIKRDYKNRIISLLDSEFPDFMKSRRIKLELISEDRFQDLYNIFKVYDVYKFSRNFSYMIENVILKDYELRKVCNVKMLEDFSIKKLNEINSESKRYMLEALNTLIQDKVIKTGFVETLISQHFSYFLVENYKSIKPLIHDFFSVKNELKYSTSKTEKLPDIINYSNLNEIKKYRNEKKYNRVGDIQEEAKMDMEKEMNELYQKIDKPSSSQNESQQELQNKILVASSDDIYFSI